MDTWINSAIYGRALLSSLFYVGHNINILTCLHGCKRVFALWISSTFFHISFYEFSFGVFGQLATFGLIVATRMAIGCTLTIFGCLPFFLSNMCTLLLLLWSFCNRKWLELSCLAGLMKLPCSARSAVQHPRQSSQPKLDTRVRWPLHPWFGPLLLLLLLCNGLACNGKGKKWKS